MSPLDPTLLAQLRQAPAVVKLAEDFAREAFYAEDAVCAGALPVHFKQDVPRIRVEAHLRILLALGPASRDAIVRLVESVRTGPCIRPGESGHWPEDFRDNPEALLALAVRVLCGVAGDAS